MALARKATKHIFSIYLKDSHLNLQRHVRCGYRLKPKDVNDKDKGVKESFDEKVSDAVLHKVRSPYRGLEKYENPETPNPNEKYFDRFDLPRYGSLNSYIEEAERQRQFQFSSPTPETMAQIWKDYFNKPKFVNIGFRLTHSRTSPNNKKKIIKQIKNNPEMEKATRERTLTLDVQELTEEWEKGYEGIKDINSIAHYYGIFADLFEHGHFYPCVQMNVDYITETNTINPVYYGNEVSPEEATKPPEITFKSDEDKLWTLLLTNPDGNLENNEKEYIHWLIGNIPGNKISAGQTLIDYLPPIPAKGTGYHRMVFLLFQQQGEVDYSEEQRDLPCLSLRQRYFLTKDFYQKYESALVPASLRFFQTRWDASVQDTYHKTLDMVHPIYEFIPQDIGRILAPLKKFPHRKTFEWLQRFMPKEPIYPGGGKFE